MSDITPIQTRYGGCLFRSRLEARWAVFFDQLSIPWLYEHEGYDLGADGRYLPDFLLYPNTQIAMWFEVKGKFPSPEELRKAQGLSRGTGLPTFIYFGELAVPAPASLAEMSIGEFMDDDEEWMWVNEYGWMRYPSGPPAWEVGIPPTAFCFRPRSEQPPRSNHWWWTDCPFCGLVILKIHGQVGWCPRFTGDQVPPDPLYPRFAHATDRLLAAYTAARSARFEHGKRGD